MRDEAMGYLSGATYRQGYHLEMENMGGHDDHHKVDLTEYEDTDLIDSETQYGNVPPSLKAAIRFDSLEGIRGNIIEEIDYENVTIVKTDTPRGGDEGPPQGGTRGDPPHSSHLYGSSADNEQDYLNVESFEVERNSRDSAGFREEQPLLRGHEASHLQVSQPTPPAAPGHHHNHHHHHHEGQGSQTVVASHDDATYGNLGPGELESDDLYMNVASASRL